MLHLASSSADAVASYADNGRLMSESILPSDLKVEDEKLQKIVWRNFTRLTNGFEFDRMNHIPQLPQPVTKDNVHLLKQGAGYMVLDKSDGWRYWIMLCTIQKNAKPESEMMPPPPPPPLPDQESKSEPELEPEPEPEPEPDRLAAFAFTRAGDIYEIKLVAPIGLYKGTILEAELVNVRDRSICFRVFDATHIGGVDIRKLKYQSRMQTTKLILPMGRKQAETDRFSAKAVDEAVAAGRIVMFRNRHSLCNLWCTIKVPVPLSKLRWLWEKRNKHNFDTDGLVFTPNVPYTQHLKPILKFKPIPTIDFSLVVHVGSALVDARVQLVYSNGAGGGSVDALSSFSVMGTDIQSVSIRQTEEISALINSMIKKAESQGVVKISTIAEFTFEIPPDLKSAVFTFYRHRKDKTEPNSKMTIESTIFAAQYRSVTIEEIEMAVN